MSVSPRRRLSIGPVLFVSLGLIGAIVLSLYQWNLGLGSVIGTSIFIGLCTATVFGRKFWRFCVSAFVRYRAGAPWQRLINVAFLACALHGLLLVAQHREIIPEQGLIDMSNVLIWLERDIHLALPYPMPRFLSWLGLAIYLWAFPGLMLSLIIILDGCQEIRLLREYLYACIGVSLFALPCFALLGVPEVWLALENDGYLPPAVDPGERMEFYRILSGKYNCLPSLHCTLTIIAMGTAIRSKIPMLMAIILPVGALICLSTVFNGLHWIIDVCLSVPLGFLALCWAKRKCHENQPHKTL